MSKPESYVDLETPLGLMRFNATSPDPNYLTIVGEWRPSKPGKRRASAWVRKLIVELCRRGRKWAAVPPIERRGPIIDRWGAAHGVHGTAYIIESHVNGRSARPDFPSAARTRRIIQALAPVAAKCAAAHPEIWEAVERQWFEDDVKFLPNSLKEAIAKLAALEARLARIEAYRTKHRLAA